MRLSIVLIAIFSAIKGTYAKLYVLYVIVDVHTNCSLYGRVGLIVVTIVLKLRIVYRKKMKQGCENFIK